MSPSPKSFCAPEFLAISLFRRSVPRVRYEPHNRVYKYWLRSSEPRLLQVIRRLWGHVHENTCIFARPTKIAHPDRSKPTVPGAGQIGFSIGGQFHDLSGPVFVNKLLSRTNMLLHRLLPVESIFCTGIGRWPDGNHGINTCRRGPFWYHAFAPATTATNGLSENRHAVEVRELLCIEVRNEGRCRVMMRVEA